MVILCKILLHYTANYSINILKEVFEGALKSCRLWPTELNPCGFYLWEILRDIYLKKCMSVCIILDANFDSICLGVDG